MSFYLITGKMGTGKSKTAVAFMRRALKKNLRVATNLDVRLEHLMPPMSKATIIRIPDKPVIEVTEKGGQLVEGGRHDLEAIGHGNPDSYDEEFNGLIILDELATWMNARTFQDKSRGAVVEWLRYSRKKGWHCYFITHDVDDIDKQVRTGLVEYVVRLTRFDKVKVPVLGGLLKLVSGGKLGTLPRAHYAVTRMGTNPLGFVADRMMYRGDDLHDAYDTRQTFSENYPHGAHSLLSAWHLKGRFLKPHRSLVQRLRERLAGRTEVVRRTAPVRPKLPLVELLSKLPADERVRHWRRLDARGAL